MYGTSVVSSAPAQNVASPLAAWRRHPRLGLAAVAVAVAVVIAAFVVGLLGLLANPVRSVTAGGTTTLEGTFEPYQCGGGTCDGYIQAGARSVFVQFPPGCAAPPRAAQITVVARPAPDLGTASYRATGCG